MNVEVRVSRGGWVLIGVLLVLAAAGCWGPVDRAMVGVPMWGLVGAVVVPLVLHEIAHLIAGALVGLRAVALEVGGAGFGAVLAGDPDDRPRGRQRRRARQQVVVSLAGPLSALPLALLGLALVADPAVLSLWLAACAGSLAQLLPRPGSDGHRLRMALAQLRLVPVHRRAALRLAIV